MKKKAHVIKLLVLLTPKPWRAILEPKIQEAYPSLKLVWVESLQGLQEILPTKSPSAKKGDDLNINPLHTLVEGDFKSARLFSILNEWIVPKSLFEQFGLGFYNIHPGPPERPGWAPLNFALYDDDKEFGATLHEALEEVDTGRIWAVDQFTIPQDCNYYQLATLTMDSVLRVFDQNLANLISELNPQFTPMTWGAKRKTKQDLLKESLISPLISRVELDLKIKAFGMCTDVCQLRTVQSGKTFVFDPLRQTARSLDNESVNKSERTESIDQGVENNQPHLFIQNICLYLQKDKCSSI